MSTRLYIGNLPSDVQNSDLDTLFAKFGEIVDIAVKDRSAGPVFAFVEFKNDSDAEEALNEMNGREYNGRTMRVEFTRGKRFDGPRDNTVYDPPKRTDYRIEVTHLPTGCSWQDLKDYMRKAGEVGYVSVRRGYAVVEYLHYDDMKRAMRKLDDTRLDSRSDSRHVHLHCCYHSHSRSRSRSRSSSASDSSSLSRSSSRSRSASC